MENQPGHFSDHVHRLRRNAILVSSIAVFLWLFGDPSSPLEAFGIKINWDSGGVRWGLLALIFYTAVNYGYHAFLEASFWQTKREFQYAVAVRMIDARGEKENNAAALTKIIYEFLFANLEGQIPKKYVKTVNPWLKKAASQYNFAWRRVYFLDFGIPAISVVTAIIMWGFFPVQAQ